MMELHRLIWTMKGMMDEPITKEPITKEIIRATRYYSATEADAVFERIEKQAAENTAKVSEMTQTIADREKRNTELAAICFERSVRISDLSSERNKIKAINEELSRDTPPLPIGLDFTELAKLVASVESLIAIHAMNGGGERERRIFDAALKYDMDPEFTGEIVDCVKHATTLYNIVHGTEPDTEAECAGGETGRKDPQILIDGLKLIVRSYSPTSDAHEYARNTITAYEASGEAEVNANKDTDNG